MWSDIETSEDLLGYTIHAGLLKQVIMNDKNLPATIGLYGDWGSGKSSILKILKEQIENADDSKDNSVVIYFDGWSFESFDDAKMALIQGIVDKLEDNKQIKANITNAVKKVKESIFSMRTLMWTLRYFATPIALGIMSGGVVTIPNLLSLFGSFKGKEKELADKLTGDDAETFLKETFSNHIDAKQFSAVRDFKKDFEELIEATGKDCVVVLIDDLDRCLPEHIIENLEAIKLFLNVKKTVFVIAADQDIVSGAIKKQYEGMINLSSRNSQTGRSIGEEYLDKFIQIPYSIPKLSNQEVKTYVTLLFCKSMLKDEDFKTIYEDYQKFISEQKFENYGWDNIKNMQGVVNNLQLQHIVTFMSHCTSTLSSSLHRNPRLIKRFLNAFELRNQLLSQFGNDDEKKSFLLLKLMLLETSHSNLFTKLYNWSLKSKGHPQEIKELEEQAKNNEIDKTEYDDWVNDDVNNLLTMEPMFSSFDLRELYWVSRDKLLDGMGGVSGISKKVRSLFDAICSFRSENILERKCESDVKSLSESDLESFYDLLDSKLFADPTEKIGYTIYYYIIKTGVGKAYPHFIETFSKVGDKAPISISNDMRRLLEMRNNDRKLEEMIKRNKPLAKLVWKQNQKN